MGRACGMHRKNKKVQTKLWSDNLKRKDHFEDLDINGNGSSRNKMKVVDWIHQDQDRD
jgi:hypothetical protein